LLLDSGNFSDHPSPTGDRKTKGLLRAMERLGYQVVNVGEREIRMGYPEFARRTEGSTLRFISSNVVDRKTKEPVFPTHAVVEALSPDGKKKVRVGVIGAVRYNPVFLKAGPKGGNMIIDHPLERVQEAFEQVRKKKVDVVVLLAALHKNDARSIAARVPGIDYVLGSYGGLVTRGDEKEGETTVIYCGNKGQRIGESRVFLDGAKSPEITARLNKLHTLSRLYPSEPGMVGFLDTLRAGDRVGSRSARP